MKQKGEEEVFRIYVGNALCAISQGKQMVRTYSDIVDPVPVDERTGDEIALEIIRRAGLEVSGE